MVNAAATKIAITTGEYITPITNVLALSSFVIKVLMFISISLGFKWLKCLSLVQYNS